MTRGHFQGHEIHSIMANASFTGANSCYSRSRFWDTVLGPLLTLASESEGVVFADRGEVLMTGSEIVSPFAMKRSTSVRLFTCNEGCTQESTQRSHLNQHIGTVHEQQRPHKCNQCG